MEPVAKKSILLSPSVDKKVYVPYTTTDSILLQTQEDKEDESRFQYPVMIGKYKGVIQVVR